MVDESDTNDLSPDGVSHFGLFLRRNQIT